MLRMVWHLGLCSFLGVAPLRATAQADPSAQQIAAGNELRAAGEFAYAAGNFAEALEDFEQAHQRLQKPTLLYLIGESAERLGKYERAVSAFEAYLAALPKAKDRAAIEKRIEADRRATKRPPAARALSPEAAARAANPEAPAPPVASPTQDTDLSRAWWLWAGAGALAVGGIVLVAVLVGPGTHEQRPAQGNVGGVVLTLEGR